MVQSITPLRVSLEKDENNNDLPNALRLTTARYYTPDNIGEDGTSIHGVGIKPDLTVKIPAAHYADLLTKGVLLGDPVLVEEGKMDPTASEPKTEEGGESKPESRDGVEEEKESMDEEKETMEEEDVKEEGDTPFYMRKKDEKVKPNTRDIQLRYGVDVLRALLIVGPEKS
jgi:hypothetical protein